jgi:thymidylate synthase
MRQYLDLVEEVLKNGRPRGDRTGTGTIASFGHRLEFNMVDGFPLVTTKKVNIEKVWIELFWMLSGKTSGQFMLDNNCHIWDEWMDENNDLGRVYGVQWRNWRGPIRTFDGNDYPQRVYIDQLQNAITTIRNNPVDRRMLVTAWRPDELDEMALPPCHILQQYFVDGEYLDLQVYQRSADVFLGLPFDIASYATLLHMVSYVTGKKPGRLIYLLGDTHVYTNHVDQMLTQLKREPYPLPTLNIVLDEGQVIKEIDDFKLGNLALQGYKSHPGLKGKVSV